MIYLEKFESFDDADSMAKLELVGAEAEMCFEFNGEYVKNPEHIRDLIEKYNHFYNKEESWGGGPPPKGFIEYFNSKYSKNKSASRRSSYPTINLIIQTDDYGKIIIGFSIKDKYFKLYNWTLLDCEDPTDYDLEVIDQICKFVKDKLNQMKLDEVISYLKLNIKNKVDWSWKSHLKLLESYFSDDESSYEEINIHQFLEFKKNHKNSTITDVDLFKISKIINIDEPNYSYNSVIFSDGGYDITISKYEDDWWSITSEDADHVATDRGTRNYYLCDSLDGLRDFMKMSYSLPAV